MKEEEAEAEAPVLDDPDELEVLEVVPPDEDEVEDEATTSS